MSSIESIRNTTGELHLIAHGVAVWFVWTLLSGTPFHDRSYGELRRLGLKGAALHVTPMLVVVGTAAYFLSAVPKSFYWILGSGLSLGAATGGLLVGSTLITSRFVDWWLTRA